MFASFEMSHRYESMPDMRIAKVSSFWEAKSAGGLQVDVYSFGVIMWEVVSHEQPSRGRMRDLKVPQECPAQVNDLINKCLAEDPVDRPSAREAYDVLKAWRDQHAAHLSHVRLNRDLSLIKGSDSAYEGNPAPASDSETY